MSLGVYNYCASFYLEMRDEQKKKKEKTTHKAHDDMEWQHKASKNILTNKMLFHTLARPIAFIKMEKEFISVPASRFMPLMMMIIMVMIK